MKLDLGISFLEFSSRNKLPGDIYGKFLLSATPFRLAFVNSVKLWKIHHERIIFWNDFTANKTISHSHSLNFRQFEYLQFLWRKSYEESYSKLCQTSKMEHFLKIVNRFKSFTNFAKYSILDVGIRFAILNLIFYRFDKGDSSNRFFSP